MIPYNLKRETYEKNKFLYGFKITMWGEILFYHGKRFYK
jgi:hypothetical protein